MKYRTRRGGILGLTIAVLVAAGPATAAPVATSPPTVTGKPVVLGQVGCQPGAWTDANAFTYSWQVGGVERATGPTWRIPPSVGGGAQITCVVTATDAAGGTGAASSAPRTVVPAQITFRFRVFSPASRTIVLQGTAGPAAARGYQGRQLTVIFQRRIGGRWSLMRFRSASRGGQVLERVTSVPPGRGRFRVIIQSGDGTVFQAFERAVVRTVRR